MKQHFLILATSITLLSACGEKRKQKHPPLPPPLKTPPQLQVKVATKKKESLALMEQMYPELQKHNIWATKKKEISQYCANITKVRPVLIMNYSKSPL